MIENLSPVAAVLVILFGALFGVLFLTWCCKQCSEAHSLQHIQRVSSGTRGYGTLVRDPYHTTVDAVARTPPPPYFETDRLLRTISI